MSREGPVSFGKPLLILVLLGCAGAGYWAWKNWPSHYEGPGWDIDFPNKWEASISTDPATPTKVVASGPMPNPEHGQGAGWVTLNYHGALAWPQFVMDNVPATLEKTEDLEIGHRKSLLFEYEEQGFRFLGSAVQRGDAVVISAVGCRKDVFTENRPLFEKVVKSVRCTR